MEDVGHVKESRKESRLRADQPVTVRSLGVNRMPPAAGRVLDISGSGLRLWMPNPIPCGSPVKVESKQMVMVGEVGRCQAEGEGYVVGLMVLHTEPIAAR
jgi:PilZ domain